MKICIAGYPRSGTNWLQRLMVQTLNGIVPKYKILEHERLEPNRSVNHFIDNPNKNMEVVRIHFLPNNLPDDITYFIYIYRHVFDVFLSSYFYFDMDQKFSLSNYSVLRKCCRILIRILNLTHPEI